MSSKTKRQQVRDRAQRQKLINTLLWVGIGIAVLSVIGFITWPRVRPQVGEAFPIMVSSPHIPPDTDPGEYNSDPPTSGLHYASEAETGFYDTNIYTYPAGYLVHNLEHGYIIFWYNCSLVSEQECSDLKEQIRGVLEEENHLKVIAYPWTSTEVPVVLTSWGRTLSFEEFDPELARDFVQRNRTKAPEPEAP